MTSEIRKGQLVTTFGVGAIHVDSNGASVMTCGLDHWFEDESTGNKIENMSLYKLEDKRLSMRLGVNHFMEPPDKKSPPLDDGGNYSEFQRTPLSGVRFPQWHVCSNNKCQRMRKIGLSQRRSPRCGECNSSMYQSRFVVACDHGHIGDFPWPEWVHRSSVPNCRSERLKLTGGGGALASMVVHCLGCGAARSLSKITVFEGDSSHLSQYLSKDEDFLCRGEMPWLGNHATDCNRPIVGILRQATNVYFSNLISSIHLPIEAAPNLADIVDMLDSDESLSRMVTVVQALPEADRVSLIKTHEKCPLEINRCSDEDILKAMEIIVSGNAKPESDEPVTETEYRRQERELMLKSTDRDTLKVTPLAISTFEPWVAKFFSAVSVVSRLTETRAMIGLDRLSVNGEKTDEQYKSQLRKTPPANQEENWLPAIRVYGEGIYLEFSQEALQGWVLDSNAEARANLIIENLARNQFVRRDTVTPGFLLLHTFAHLLMNRLVFDCGYSSAALRERIYESNDPDHPMAGILIYTASGDSEGSLGGLVAKGRPGELEPIISKALAEAQWCSSDPVCTESGNRGQGPGSLNLAACHSCALVPETSCETMNMFLDRQCVVSHAGTGEGYFDKLGI